MARSSAAEYKEMFAMLENHTRWSAAITALTTWLPRRADAPSGNHKRVPALVDEWDGMTTDERRKVLSAIFDSVTATSDGIDRLEPCEDWRPYVAAAIPGHWVPTERKTGLQPAVGPSHFACSRWRARSTAPGRVRW